VFEHFGLAVNNTDAGWREELLSGEDVEIAAVAIGCDVTLVETFGFR